jgi:hypothetical protein
MDGKLGEENANPCNACWAPSLDQVIVFYEDLCKKQVEIFYSMNKIDDALAPMRVDKGFKVSDI